ncbi:MAG: penicillin-binding transpeptidase domain-containing protein [Cyclobacteriaceae bacterium]|nr:penicillin-binding transpeptidase domain-containing protein [Cyclobacteriaceae bacterium]
MGRERKIIIQIFIVLIGVIFIMRLFNLQLIDETFAQKAQDNIIHKEIEYPYRGLIYDRNGKLLVYNKPEYDLMIIPREAAETDVDKFCAVFNITREQYAERHKAAKKFSSILPSVFIKQLSHEQFASVQDLLIDFPGFKVKARTGRAYTYHSMANALGYVSEISKSKLDRDTANYYKQGDYIGQTGIEAYYEDYLRGKRGIKYKVRNVKGVDKGSFKDGEYDTLAVTGLDLKTTIDIDLQLYGEKLMEGKSGSIVVIEPASGEILSFVSGPSYDPTLLTGREYGNNFQKIALDTAKLLFNRPLMAQYRPGSIFKIIQAMIGLETGVITPQTRITCDRRIIGCHGAHSYEDLKGAITRSCNPYFYSVMRQTVLQGRSKDIYEDSRLGLNEWNKHVRSFGLGKPLGIDLPNEQSGLIPDADYYDRAYRGRPWKFSNIYSIAIGEGENMVVPIQMANFATIVANRGHYYIPHFVKEIGDSTSPLDMFKEKHMTSINESHFELAADAMQQVVEMGTGLRARIPGLEVCGKTGTVQNDPLPDHSVFIAFAPKIDPKIAVSVYVEDSGQGGRAAAAIAGLMIEKYLYGETKRQYMEDFVLKGEFLY